MNFLQKIATVGISVLTLSLVSPWAQARCMQPSVARIYQSVTQEARSLPEGDEARILIGRFTAPMDVAISKQTPWIFSGREITLDGVEPNGAEAVVQIRNLTFLNPVLRQLSARTNSTQPRLPFEPEQPYIIFATRTADARYTVKRTQCLPRILPATDARLQQINRCVHGQCEQAKRVPRPAVQRTPTHPK